ncbi:CBS domain protein [Dictyocaulus viviparus]|uniref:CBS domain protein n=1 Tax=Dictyocaulus viviparus TaxID=29172 RepID=A0A0D8XBE5_DICVI|nr:CBS domain protein [Dictyocaulus viviparus]
MSHSESVSPQHSPSTLESDANSERSSQFFYRFKHNRSSREKLAFEVSAKKWKRCITEDFFSPIQVDSYARLFQMNQCYEAMPMSNTRHVLLSNSEEGGLIAGILSVTDFIRVMLMLYREQKQNSIDDYKENIGNLTIRKYRELIQKEGKFKELVYVNADNSLLEAARLLAQHRIHRLPVLDPETGSPLFILTHKRLLKFLWCFGQHFAQPQFHIRSAKDLNVGSWVGIRVVFPDTPLVDCLDILLNKGVSGVPVVERDTFKVVDMYSRFDAVGVALEENACLDVTVEQALKFKHLDLNKKDRVVSVRDTDTLWKAITVLVEKNVHRLCAVNEKGGIEGVISLSDVINHMVVKPGENLKLYRIPRRHYTYHSSDCSDKNLRNRLHHSAAFLEDTASGRIRKDVGNLTIH